MILRKKENVHPWETGEIGLAEVEADDINLIIKIKRVRKSSSPLPLPSFMTPGSSGCDLMADIDEPLILRPSERVLVPTGIAIEIPLGYEAQVRPRSGLALKKGITVPNTPGTIDADYRGEIQVVLINLSFIAVTIQRGDRIAQLVFQKVCPVQWKEVGALDKTLRGKGGFGHTGVDSKKAP